MITASDNYTGANSDLLQNFATTGLRPALAGGTDLPLIPANSSRIALEIQCYEINKTVGTAPCYIMLFAEEDNGGSPFLVPIGVLVGAGGLAGYYYKTGIIYLGAITYTTNNITDFSLTINEVNRP